MFKMEFEKRITAGNDKHATGRDRQIAAAKAAELRARIAPFFLRREKKDVLPQTDRQALFATHGVTGWCIEAVHWLERKYLTLLHSSMTDTAIIAASRNYSML